VGKMAVTTKTLTPTGQVVSIPDMTEKPNASVLSDGIGKEADAINALAGNLQKVTNATIPACSTVADVKTYILSIISQMSAGETRLIGLTTGFEGNGFTNGDWYEGFLHCLSKTGNGYFSLSLHGYHLANVVDVSCENGTWTFNSLSSNVKKLESCVEHAIIDANGGTKSVFVGTHGVVLLVGFLGASGGIAVLVQKSSNSIYRAINMFTGEAWSSTNLSFSTSGDNVVITNNASQVSYFSILAAGSSR
jgi:hypothetical protein